MRTHNIPLSRFGIFGNRALNVWAAGVVVFLLAAIYLPGLNTRLGMTPIGLESLLGLAALAVGATSWLETRKIARANKAHSEPTSNSEPPDAATDR